jgi:hypothetical protein
MSHAGMWHRILPAGSAGVPRFFVRWNLLVPNHQLLATDGHGFTRIKPALSYPCESVSIRGQICFVATQRSLPTIMGP